MTQSEAFYYPRIYYRDIAFFCSNHITRIFSPTLTIFMFDDNNGWQEHLQSVIEHILLKARLDDTIAIGAMVLLESFQQTHLLRPEYPNDVYIQYFLGAYISAHRLLSKRGTRKGFWKDVIGGPYTERRLEKIEHNFLAMLGGHVHIDECDFVDMKRRMYGLIRTHMMLRSGEMYDQDCVLKAGDLSPCHAEMIRLGMPCNFCRPAYFCSTYVPGKHRRR
ncbi:hypothetical protein BDN70DRAFT_877521 [Pholiota conissans]|uniref:Uncharacterized protein n=1 Tax=Pholiota conissans TaxID=109636 RepID=A0A9P5Z335_9AGAR|nr:hypothetical protein BDN70DRAFT_877521 [Pholiota conissans]